MFSPTKKLDKEFLLELADMIETLVRLEKTDLAEKFGEQYLALETKIKTYDYTRDDELYDRLQSFTKGTARMDILSPM